MSLDDIDRRISQAMARIRGTVEYLSDLVFNDDGTVTGKGLGDENVESSVGWHFGFYSKPKDGGRGISVKSDGQGNTSVLVAFRDVQYEMSLSKGECGMKNAFDAYLLLNQNGVAEVNGTDYDAPKWGGAFFEDFVAYMTVVDTLLKTLVPVTGATGTAAYATATALPTSLIIKMLTSSNYVSSKVKTG